VGQLCVCDIGPSAAGGATCTTCAAPHHLNASPGRPLRLSHRKHLNLPPAGRFSNSPYKELGIAAAEQMKITEIRLKKAFESSAATHPADRAGRRTGQLLAHFTAAQGAPRLTPAPPHPLCVRHMCHVTRHGTQPTPPRTLPHVAICTHSHTTPMFLLAVTCCSF
jgi:hypothetical protein